MKYILAQKWGGSQRFLKRIGHFHEAVGLVLGLAKVLLKRTEDWFLGTVECISIGILDISGYWLNICLRMTKICKFSGLIIESSDSSSVVPGHVHLFLQVLLGDAA